MEVPPGGALLYKLSELQALLELKAEHAVQAVAGSVFGKLKVVVDAKG
jgi:hypothetical protein